MAYEEAAAASSAVADRVEAAGEAPKVVVVQVWEVLEAVGWEVAAQGAVAQVPTPKAQAPHRCPVTAHDHE